MTVGDRNTGLLASSSRSIQAMVIGGIFILLFAQLVATFTTVRAASGDWSTYLYDNGRSGYNAAEKIINPTSASKLKVYWTARSGGAVFSQPVISNGTVYWGSLDGYEHATNLKGTEIWKQFLGHKSSQCSSKPVGVVSTATVASVSINGHMTSVVFVGGGDAKLYALNASTGAVIWQTHLAASSSNAFIWDSPAVYNGSVYIGIASIDDCPVIQGQVFKLNAASGNIQSTFNIVPPGCLGGGLWGSITIDSAAGTLYFATGNPNRCSKTEPYAIALVELQASDLTYLDSWQTPISERVKDSDFGSTPTLFQATIHGRLVNMVGIANKNGKYYAFDRTAIHNGPVWKVSIAKGGACPECGDGSISPSAWDGSTLYVAGGNTSINGTSCKGSLRALDPATGAFLWEHCMKDGPVLPAVTVVPGVAMVVEGPYLVLVTAASGKPIFRSSDSNSTAHFYGAVGVSNGVAYIGSQNSLYAFVT